MSPSKNSELCPHSTRLATPRHAMYALSHGDPVLVHSIENKPGMNGLFGTTVCQCVDQKNPVQMRWKVRFEDGTVCRLQPKNLKLRMPVPKLLEMFRAAMMYNMEPKVRDLMAKAHMHETSTKDAGMALRIAFMAICELMRFPDGRAFSLMWCDTVPNITAPHTVANANEVEIKCLYTPRIFEQLAEEFDKIANMHDPKLKLSPGRWMFPTSVCRAYTFVDREPSEDDVSPKISAVMNIVRGILADVDSGNAGSGAKVRVVNI